MIIACAHPEGDILLPSEVLLAFGPTATNLIPVHPGYRRLRNDSKAPVFLSKLPCSHILMVSPSTVAAAREKDLKVMLEPSLEPVAEARAYHAKLLEKARAGQEVTPAEVAEAKAAIQVAELAEEGRLERLETQRILEEHGRRKAVEGPVRDDLAESRQNIQDAQDEAYRALMALLDAVDEDRQVHESAVSALLAGGFEVSEVRPPAQGMMHQTVAAGESFPYWPKLEHLVAVLNQVRQGRHRNSFFSTSGRDLGKGLPASIAKGPRVSPDVVGTI